MAGARRPPSRPPPPPPRGHPVYNKEQPFPAGVKPAAAAHRHTAGLGRRMAGDEAPAARPSPKQGAAPVGNRGRARPHGGSDRPSGGGRPALRRVDGKKKGRRGSALWSVTQRGRPASSCPSRSLPPPHATPPLPPPLTPPSPPTHLAITTSHAERRSTPPPPRASEPQSPPPHPLQRALAPMRSGGVGRRPCGLMTGTPPRQSRTASATGRAGPPPPAGGRRRPGPGQRTGRALPARQAGTGGPQ